MKVEVKKSERFKTSKELHFFRWTLINPYGHQREMNEKDKKKQQ